MSFRKPFEATGLELGPTAINCEFLDFMLTVGAITDHTMRDLEVLIFHPLLITLAVRL